MRNGFVKSKPRQERTTNPFLKKDVPIISNDLTNAAEQNFREAVGDPKPVAVPRPRTRRRPNVGSVRG